jgi:dolichyl-phosphate beta-glucosyltransferase
MLSGSKKRRAWERIVLSHQQFGGKSALRDPLWVRGPTGVYDGESLPLEAARHSAGAVVDGVTENLTYSIVIPAYNESRRILATLESVVECLRAQQWNAEVVVVNDGSTDGTADIVRQFQAQAPEVRLIENPGNRGKGYSVRSGMMQAKGEVLMFSDADLSAPIEEAERLFAAIAGGADIAIGSRWLESSRQTHRQPLYRQFFGRCFNAVTRLVMGLPFADTQCGFKAFTRAAARTVFQLQTIERWGFDPEILFIALKRGLRVVEVPVSWAHDARSRMSYLRDGVRMLEDVAIVRWNALLGRYRGSGVLPESSGKAL